MFVSRLYEVGIQPSIYSLLIQNFIKIISDLKKYSLVTPIKMWHLASKIKYCNVKLHSSLENLINKYKKSINLINYL